MPEIKQLTMQETCRRMRSLGLHVSIDTLKAGIESGTYGFGKILHLEGRKSCKPIIFEVDFDRWVAEKTRKSQ